VLDWTDGRALVATGSPFPPAVRDGISHRIAQANNALIFPGLGLGVKVARASRISDAMIRASADCLAQLCDTTTTGAPLLPAIDDLRTVSAAVAVEVALAAADDGLARGPLDNAVQRVHDAMWQAQYAPIVAEVDD
jgi:malate dehydrogenase (oxaloacetate-decarboxylating)